MYEVLSRVYRLEFWNIILPVSTCGGGKLC